MAGFVGFGYHDSKCTIVHFEGELRTYDYCLICRTQSLCRAALRAAREGDLLDHTEPLDCVYPRALVSEEESRIDELRVDKEHDRNHEMRHYQEPGFVEPTNKEEASARFWPDLERRYHYCIVCQRFTNECSDARPGGRPCKTEHTDVAIDDSEFVRVAWEASQVQASVPV